MAVRKKCPRKGCKQQCDQAALCCVTCLRADQRQAREEREAQEIKARAERRQAAEAARQVQANRPAEVLVQEDRDRQRLAAENQGLRRRYNEALGTIERYEEDRRTLNILSEGLAPLTIEPTVGNVSDNEGTAVAVASDWHVEERVDPRKVNGLNESNLEIATMRSQKFFRSLVRLVKLFQQDITINNLVLALLGDFISNQIHDELAENNDVTPTHAIIAAQNMIIAGIEYVLDNTELNLTVPCHSGNHGRVTKKTRFTEENGHSLEFLMYHTLAHYFRGNDRIKFMIALGPHSFMNIYDVRIRFQHGHMVKYQGGVGGIYIPVNKAIAQWNKATPVDLDVFGHFHQHRDGGNFICNGSLIGYNAFALSIKADYEAPKQALFLIDRKRGRTCNWPILFTK